MKMRCEKHNFDYTEFVYPNGCPICLSEDDRTKNQKICPRCKKVRDFHNFYEGRCWACWMKEK